MKTSKKSSLFPDLLKDSLRIKFNMNTISNFNTSTAVIQWLKMKNRHNKINPKASSQGYFEGVFNEAKVNKETNLHDYKASC